MVDANDGPASPDLSSSSHKFIFFLEHISHVISFASVEWLLPHPPRMTLPRSIRPTAIASIAMPKKIIATVVVIKKLHIY